MLLLPEGGHLGEVIINPNYPISHELLAIELCKAQAENCDVKADTCQMIVGVEPLPRNIKKRIPGTQHS
jgi:hypothetical protein